MQPERRSFDAFAFALFLGVETNTIRDWRRRGFLDGVGARGENGRWSYTEEDLSVCRTARRLGAFFEMADAMKVAHEVAAARLSGRAYVMAGRKPSGELHTWASDQPQVGPFPSAHIIRASAFH